CKPNDLGAFLVPAWDAVMLADALLPDRPPTGKDYLTSLNKTAITLATGAQATVQDGELCAPTVPVLMWHVDPVVDPSHIWARPSPDPLLPTDPTTNTSHWTPCVTPTARHIQTAYRKGPAGGEGLGAEHDRWVARPALIFLESGRDGARLPP